MARIVAYMDVGKGREHAYMDIGGRAMQEQLPRMRKLSQHSFCISSIHGGQRRSLGLHGWNLYDYMDIGGRAMQELLPRVESGTETERKAGLASLLRTLHLILSNGATL